MKTRYFEDGGGVGGGEGEGGFGGIGSADGGPSGLGGNVGGGQGPGDGPAGAEGIGSVSDGGFGGGSDAGGIADLLSALSDKTSQPMLSSEYTPQDMSRQFYQPVYKPSYQDYNQGNPLAVSQYGQDYVSTFGQFQNPFSYFQQSYTPQFFMPQANYMGGQGLGGLSPFGDYGMQFEGMTSPNYGIAGLYR
jgi:hypothetical protein